MKFVPILFLLMCLGCSSRPVFSSDHSEIDATNVVRIEIHLKENTLANLLTVKNKDSITAFADAFNQATYDGMWKGLRWDKIWLITVTDTTSLLTNGKVFGTNTSGKFYRLPREYRNLWQSKRQ